MAEKAIRGPMTWFSFSFGKNNRTSKPAQVVVEDADYIPYNGPVEPPRSTYRPRKDSWGDPLEAEPEPDSWLDPELHLRYGGHSQDTSSWSNDVDEKRGMPRARTQSGVSGRTVSSGAVDPAHLSIRQSTTSAVAPPVPHYINSACGGVGESPAPPSRSNRDPTTGQRVSLTQIFTFGNPNRKSLLGPKTRQPHSPGPSSPQSSHRISTEWPSSNEQFGREARPMRHFDLPESTGVFSTPSSPTYHPYANPMTVVDAPPPTPQTANPIAPTPFRLRKPSSKTSLLATAPYAAPGRELKNSISTPNLRDQHRLDGLSYSKPKFNQKAKDRWLAVETWCDAIMFPRPRFKMNELGSRSERIVSPPGSPILQSNAPPAITSRVLAHSRSLVDLQQPQISLQQKERNLMLVPPVDPTAPSGSMPPRPRSFALDDLALPSPIPSLSKVLEDGQILDHQRKKWQMQAQNSFQNSRARTLSRSRTKSLSKVRRPDIERLPTIDFLAARSLLGNQSMIPVADAKQHPTRLRKLSLSKSDATKSPSRSNSLSKSLTKTSKSHSRAHSRSDSLGKSALKIAKAFWSSDDKPIHSPIDDAAGPLERALRDEKTKVIRLADPAYIHVDGDSTPTSVSPTPSRISDSRVGIALSTPPPFASEAAAEDVVRLPSHPYAQGGLYTYNGDRDYAGPHPTTRVRSSQVTSTDVQRHRFPPQAFLHPYAQASWRNSYQTVVPQLRPDSDIPLEDKMWAQFSPGTVREILPHEIQYSPFLEDGSRMSQPVILDTIGVGETLYNAMHRPRSKDGDSGLGTSEDHAVEGRREEPSGSISSRPYLQPAQKSSSIFPRNFASPDSQETVPPVFRSTSDISQGHSQQSSSPDSHGALQPVDDIEHFRDLFYRPSTLVESQSVIPSSNGPLTGTTNDHWPRRTRSGLTSLARQLSEEFEELAAEFGEPTPDDTNSASRLRFVLSETTSLQDASLGMINPESIPAFRPSDNIPEDVQSSRASSIMERPDESNGTLRMGLVESVSTPPATVNDFRKSYTALAEDEEQTVVTRPPHDSLAAPTLSLPSSDPTRSSYLTTSSLSRMSGLSDFPVPPPRDSTPAHMSVLSSYFSDMPQKHEDNKREMEILRNKFGRRLTFGEQDDIDELLANLSSSDHS